MQLFRYAPVSGLSGKGVMVTEEPSDDDEPPPDAVKDDDELNDNGEECNKKDIEEQTENTSKEENETGLIMETKTMASPRQDDFPICWFEDELSGEPLRWHLFIGVLHDAMKGKAAVQNSSQVVSSAAEPNLLPWRIRLHFRSYPTTLLPLEVGLQNTACAPKDDSTNDSCRDINHTNQISSSIGRIFRNSLKQALFMQYSSAKVAMSISKSSHEKIWSAILSTDYVSYREVNNSLQVGISSEPGVVPAATGVASDVPGLIPVRVMLNSDSVMQKPCRAFRDVKESKEQSKQDHTDEEEPTEDDKVLENLVERLESCSIRQKTTLGDVLLSWLPQHFESDAMEAVVAKPSVYYSIQGIRPKLSSSILDLWKCLCHPDHFLYITVIA